MGLPINNHIRQAGRGGDAGERGMVEAQKQKDKRDDANSSTRGPILSGARTGDDGEGDRQIHQESTLSATRPRESKVQAVSKRQPSTHDHLLVDFMCI